MKVLVVIPSRYASTRFPGKPLAVLGGKTVVERVWERVCGCKRVDRTIVATDDDRIAAAVRAFGGEAMMTLASHRSGTDRCGEVVRRLTEQGERYDVVVNVQGDEPFISNTQIEQLVDVFTSEEVQVATLRSHIERSEELFNTNNVKMVCDSRGRALYFSRQAIPYCRGVAEEEWVKRTQYFKHIGVYAFRTEVLEALCQLELGNLEECERLEQLRWLEAGYSIEALITNYCNIGIDTPDDLAMSEKIINQEK